jgi:hypothetical protein
LTFASSTVECAPHINPNFLQQRVRQIDSRR